MKRISILVTVGMAASSYAAAVCSTVPFTCGVVYSPYALEYGCSGLIPDCVRYSPYALGYGNSGMIPNTVRYSSYAFDNQRSGLISDVGSCFLPCATWDDVLARGSEPERACPATGCWGAGARASAELPEAQGRQMQALPVGPSRAEGRKDSIEPDQRRAVRDYLNRMCPGRYEITGLLSLDNEAVCFDVVLKDENVIVKYWNADKIEAVHLQGGYRQKALTKYLLDWIDYRDRFETAGGKVYHVASEDTYELLRELAACLHASKS